MAGSAYPLCVERKYPPSDASHSLRSGVIGWTRLLGSHEITSFKVMLADGGTVLWTLEWNDISAPMKTSQEARPPGDFPDAVIGNRKTTIGRKAQKIIGLSRCRNIFEG